MSYERIHFVLNVGRLIFVYILIYSLYSLNNLVAYVGIILILLLNFKFIDSGTWLGDYYISKELQKDATNEELYVTKYANEIVEIAKNEELVAYIDSINLGENFARFIDSYTNDSTNKYKKAKKFEGYEKHTKVMEAFEYLNINKKMEDDHIQVVKDMIEEYITV